MSAIGIDIGGASIRAGIVDAGGKLILREVVPLPTRGEPRALNPVLRKLVQDVTSKAGPSTPRPIGIGLPGIWDRATGVMRKAVNLPALVGVNLHTFFRDACGGATHIDSDVNCAAWAQHAALQPQPRRLVYLSLGTGVGGGVVIDGHLMRHTNGGGGHFGFLCVEADDRLGAAHGHAPVLLSDLVGGPALAHHSARELDIRQGQPVESLGPRTLSAAARALAFSIRNLIAIYQPDAVLLGGGVIDHFPTLVAATDSEYRRLPHPLALPDFRIAAAPLATHDAGVIGAALLALNATAHS